MGPTLPVTEPCPAQDHVTLPRSALTQGFPFFSRFIYSSPSFSATDGGGGSVLPDRVSSSAPAASSLPRGSIPSPFFSAPLPLGLSNAIFLPIVDSRRTERRRLPPRLTIQPLPDPSSICALAITDCATAPDPLTAAGCSRGAVPSG